MGNNAFYKITRKELNNLLNDPVVLGYHILLTGYRNAPVLQGVIRLPKKILPVIF